MKKSQSYVLVNSVSNLAAQGSDKQRNKRICRRRLTCWSWLSVSISVCHVLLLFSALSISNIMLFPSRQAAPWCPPLPLPRILWKTTITSTTRQIFPYFYTRLYLFCFFFLIFLVVILVFNESLLTWILSCWHWIGSLLPVDFDGVTLKRTNQSDGNCQSERLARKV